jgi:hypothetical protein
MVTKVDSNVVGLRYAVEQTIGVLPGSPVWTPLEPNSYGDYGALYKTTARDPINASRQRRKGALTDLETNANFEIDFTQSAMRALMPSFFFAAWRDKKNFAVSAITGTNTYTIAGNSGAAAMIAGDLVFGAGFTNSGNNGLKKLTSATSTTAVIAGLTNETPPADALLTKVGAELGSADLTVATHALGATLGSTTFDFTTLGLIAGEWLFVGGDSAGTKFATAADNGWYRVYSVAAHSVVCDRVPGTIVNDSGTGKTVRIFVGHLIKNESDPTLIARQTLQLERQFDAALNSEYLLGMVGSEFSMDIKAGDSKVVCSMVFMGLSEERVTAKSGTRPNVVSESCFTASNDFSRLRLQREDTDATLATYVDNLKLSIKNNCSYNKAIGVLGSWEITVGDFEVMGEAEAFFASFDAADAIATNEDVSIDFAMVQSNAGWLWDLPLVTLGDARQKVQKDMAVKLPLKADAVAHATLNHTLLAQYFAYLPDLAE